MFTMDSFGSDLPSNWEALCDFLNAKADATIGPDDDRHDAENDLWERFCCGDFDNDPDFPGYDRTYANYMRDHPEENVSWCRPYVSDDGRYAMAINEGECVGAVTPAGIVEDPSADDVNAIAQAVNRDYDLYRGYDDIYIATQAMHETGCASCPFFDLCDAMRQDID